MAETLNIRLKPTVLHRAMLIDAQLERAHLFASFMSAIDFDMDISRIPDPKGDRVKVTMSGKFLPYKTY